VKNILPVLIFSLFFSCKKNSPFNLDDFSVCGERIDCRGDSQTWGILGVKYPTYLAQLTGCETLNHGFSGHTSTQIVNDMMGESLSNDVLVLWVGRNNAWEVDQIDADIDRAIKGRRKYFILEILNGTWQSEWAGTPYYENVTALNKRLSVKHGSHFVWLKPYLQLFQDGSRLDSTLVANDCVPQSFIIPNDSLHINQQGNYRIAEKVSMQMILCDNSILN
jgi:hypothetical protein